MLPEDFLSRLLSVLNCSILVLLFISGCAAQVATNQIQARELAPAVMAEIKRAEFLGKAMFEQDIPAARATDELLRHGVKRGKTDVVGWITVPADDGWLVRFIAEGDNDNYSAVYDVRIPKTGRPIFTELSPRERLPQKQAAMFRARQTAIAAVRKNCSDAYNTIVLSDPDSPEGWLVYVLAATQVTDEMVLGGHHRVRVTADGRSVLQDTPLSKSCLRIPPPNPEAGKVVAAYATHLVSSTPIETHVFVNLLHHRPLLVGTDLGVWGVDEGKIKYIRPMKTEQEK